MSAKMKLSGDVSAVEEAVVRQLPCTVHFTGRANVAQRFEPYLEPVEGSNTTKTTKGYFRGYPLVGTELPVPNGYKGVVFSSSTTDDGQVLKVKSKFDRMTYFNWSSDPSPTDPQQAIHEWVTVANAIHNDDD